MQTNGTNILLVEDDPVSVAVTERGFKTAPPGTKLCLATDGIEAYRYINGADKYSDRDAYPFPDVILLDIHLPRFDGLEFLRWLREKAPETSRSLPVVIISSSGSSKDLESARALGVQMFLLKPIKWPTLWALGLLNRQPA